jgi:hypothetical protein
MTDLTFIDVVELELDGMTFRFRGLGMSELISIQKEHSAISNPYGEIKKLQDEIASLESNQERTPEEEERYYKLVDDFQNKVLKASEVIKKMIFDHVIDVRQGDKVGTKQEAEWLLDRKSEDDIQDILGKIKPDTEKNSQSQS